jgi:hypothetical protein|tara:strand:- start:16281 stop:17129 length:849 start_codon:yes stop_codon:yes gene_type:complete
MAYGRNIYYDQSVYINGSEIKGVQSFDGNWSVPNTPMLAAGYEFVGTEIEGELVGEVSVSRQIVSSSDPIPNLIGSPINGYLLYGPNHSRNKSFNFNQGYITSFQSSCAVGEVATSDFSLTAYGGIGSGNITNTSYTPITPTVALANSMTLNTSFGSTNAIQSYDFDLSLNVRPIYKMGDMFVPSDFEIESPLASKVNFTITADEYEIKNLFNSICSTDFIENLSITLNEKCDGPEITSFSFNGAKLVDSSISADIGNNLTINLGYEKYYSNASDAKNSIFS